MNKKVIIGIVVFLLTGVAAVAYSVTRTPEEMAVMHPTAKTAQSINQPAMSPANGAYVDYTSDVIANTKGNKVLFFHAAWCPQCRALEADIKTEGVPAGFTIIKVDYDTHQSLRQKYGVTLQTTLVKIDDNGNFLSKYVAYDEPTLDSVKRNFLL